MSSVHILRDKLAVVGWSCRLPGANSIDQFWELLLEGKCSVTSVPSDRFLLDRFVHPKRQERGKSYTFAAGVIDDLWGFDPTVFGISPREALQLDPQQRLLLQLTWEALEDAGIRPSSLAGSDTGVFVGGSQSDYGQTFFSDPAIADSYFATGTALSVLSNRISYILDLRGPSVTVDTACSSSLVALYQAVEALNSGRIETAIVAGVNAISSPAAFIAFSQAAMLSPTGRCRAFSEDADGFVRGEGGVALVLRKASHARANLNPMHGFVVAADVNSDGRTNGISLPSVDAQEALLNRIYSRAGVSSDQLAFVEAHGTGTQVGDPIEAIALGRALGRERQASLPIGSVKTNIGHLEPASGLAGMLKALLALNHGILPKSLHFKKPNPHIDFDGLRLKLCSEELLLSPETGTLAGVNSFGFGGTNAHAIVERGLPESETTETQASVRDGQSIFFLSAQTKEALKSLSRLYSSAVLQIADPEVARIASAVVHRRERMKLRIAVSSCKSKTVGEALFDYAQDHENGNIITGSTVADDAPVAFVYSGNGSQWPGMGRTAYDTNKWFRDSFNKIDALFTAHSGWSLRAAMFGEDLEERLKLTSVAQPLIFAIQYAATEALRANGLRPAVVLGHSIGEVAAACASGALDPRAAVKVIFYRSKHQELARFQGSMAVALVSPEDAKQLIDGVEGIEIAAFNSPRAVTLAGTHDGLKRFKQIAAEERIAIVELDLDYPFHTRLLNPIEQPLISDLRTVEARDATTPFISSVTGRAMPGNRLNAEYWWQNIRKPVDFTGAVRGAAKLGARCFVEIGPSATLVRHIESTLESEHFAIAKLSVLDRQDGGTDPFVQATAKAFVAGAEIDISRVFGEDPGPSVPLPLYPWQQVEFRFTPTVESIGTQTEHHPLLGDRLNGEILEWRSHVDTSLFPELSDHKLADQVIFPGTGFLEISLAAAVRWLKQERIIIADCEILRPMDLSNGETREVKTHISSGSSTVEIFSRNRLSQSTWILHSRAKIVRANEIPLIPTPQFMQAEQFIGGDQLYRIGKATGLDYGKTFRLAKKTGVHGDRLISVELLPSEYESTPYIADPVRFDACLHGILTAFPSIGAEKRGVTYVPIRVDEVEIYRSNAIPARSELEILSKSERSMLLNVTIFDGDNRVIASLRGARCHAIPLRRTRAIEETAVVESMRYIAEKLTRDCNNGVAPADVLAHASRKDCIAEDSFVDEADMIIEGWATAAAYEIANGLSSNKKLDVNRLVDSGRLPEDRMLWLHNILLHLETAGLAKEERPSVWKIVSDRSLPKSAAVVRTLIEEQPQLAAEVLMAGGISGCAGRIKRDGKLGDDSVVTPAMRYFYEYAERFKRDASETLWKVLSDIPEFWPRFRTLRILQIGDSPFAEIVAASRRDSVEVIVIVETGSSLDRARRRLGSFANVSVIDGVTQPANGKFDLIVSALGLHALPGSTTLAWIRESLVEKGLLVAIEESPSLFKDLAFGFDPAWFANSVDGFPIGALQNGDQWESDLRRAAFDDVQSKPVRYGTRIGSLLVATVHREEAARAPSTGAEKIRPTGESPARKRILITGCLPLAKHLGAEEGVEVLKNIHELNEYHLAFPVAFVFEGDRPAGANNAERIANRCLAIKQCAERMPDAKAELWLLFSGARESSGNSDPVETAAWAFSRVLANEFHKINVRRVDICRDADPRRAASMLMTLLRSDTEETELYIDDSGIRVCRLQELSSPPIQPRGATPGGVKLVRQMRAASRMTWQATGRHEISDQEVEIAVEATGLNFRDLMWVLGLLPDDMLEDGYTGPALGLECAGKVSRIGANVKNVKIGDRVVAMAPCAFSTYCVVSAQRVAKIPHRLSYESAATIPVAFLTAYYSLVTLAKIKRNDMVLIHGGAGGVGLAAIQIAKSRGAKVIATAGSVAKREVLRSLGVKHVLDSRAVNIAEHVREVSKEGVDIVLNSLAGDAIERSIACLRPFGRFIELGKRDYVSNTHIGLRPFRKNLSYFGVDVDQLTGKHSHLGERAFVEVMKGFQKGIYSPLPHSVFSASDVADAFELMQRAHHIGKIVIRPPKSQSIKSDPKSFIIDPAGSHFVTGAFGGFGLETAKWLVDRGARSLILVGRKGAATPEAQKVLGEFRAAGVKVLAEACDVGDAMQVQRLFETIDARMPPLAGVIHSAMVLDDAVMENLDYDRFINVLYPKVIGTDNLDAMTRNRKLDYFVMFSSVTTSMGNPGQGNYVAANAYMEGVARRRRAEGLPALAIGWGPILDVGVIARNQKLKQNLKKIMGVSGLVAREALELMLQALAYGPLHPDAAVMTISPNEGGFATDLLPILKSPTYARLTRSSRTLSSEAIQIDVKALVKADGIDAARRKISDVIASHLAHVLHSPEEDISRTRPLADMGLDSLMALELMTALEQSFIVEVPLSASARSLTVVGLADTIVSNAIGRTEDGDTKVAEFAKAHLTEVSAEKIVIAQKVAKESSIQSPGPR